MNTVKTPLATLLMTALLAAAVAGCSAINQEGDYVGTSDGGYAAPPPAQSSDEKES